MRRKSLASLGNISRSTPTGPFTNIYLPGDYGTTQIDHLFVSPVGVFVVETKNMTGWIFGNERDRQWTQRIYRQTYRFQNPLRQNYAHVRAVASVARIPVRSVHSIVVFIGDAEIKTPMPPNVTIGTDFVDYIETFSSVTFSEAQVSEICACISNAATSDTSHTRRAHMREVQSKRRLNAQR